MITALAGNATEEQWDPSHFLSVRHVIGEMINVTCGRKKELNILEKSEKVNRI